MLDSAGESGRLAGGDYDHQDLSESLISDSPGIDLFNALEVIQELGTDEGRDHLERVAADLKYVLPHEDAPSREFVARLWISSRTSSPARELIMRAQLTQTAVSSTRAYREFVCDGATSNRGIDSEKLKEEVSNWCRANGKAEVISVVPQRYNEDWYCHIFRGDTIKRVVEVRDSALSQLQYRPAATDLLRFDPRTGRIGIATRSPQLAIAYRGILGQLLSDDDQFFGCENVCSLRPLQARRRELFKRIRLSGILGVDVVYLLWRRGDRDKMSISGEDCFQIVEDLEVNLSEGDLIEAKLLVHFVGKTRPGRVWIKVPRGLEIKAGRHSAVVEQLLDAAGLRGAFSDDGMSRNFWSLYPWRQKDVVWRRRLSPAGFDALVSRGLLRSVTLRAVTHPDHPATANALEVVDVSPGDAVGVSEDPVVGIRSLTSSDLEGYQLEQRAVAGEVQTSLSLEGSCEELADGGGLWQLGRRTLAPGHRVAVFLAVREPSGSAAALIQSATGGATAVLLIPQCCSSALGGIVSVPCAIPQGPHNALLEAIVTQLGWQDDVPAILWATEDLILDTVRGVAWYLGVQLTALRAGTHPFRLLTALAKARGGVVQTRELNDALSAERGGKDAVKSAKRDLNIALNASFEAAGRDAPTEEIISSRAGRCALNVSVKILS